MNTLYFFIARNAKHCLNDSNFLPDVRRQAIHPKNWGFKVYARLYWAISAFSDKMFQFSNLRKKNYPGISE